MVERIVSRAIWDSQFRRKRHSSKLRLDSSVKLTLRCLSKYLVGYLAVGHTITEMFSEPSHPSSTNDNGVLVPSSAHQVSFAISTIHLAKLSVRVPVSCDITGNGQAVHAVKFEPGQWAAVAPVLSGTRSLSAAIVVSNARKCRNPGSLIYNHTFDICNAS